MADQNGKTNAQQLSKKAQQCLAKSVDVPGSPLFHLGKAAALNSQSSFDTVQKAIDYLTCKAQAKMPFDEDEKEFLVEIYESFWWGGKYKGMHEAAALANHYVNGKGKALKISATPYQKSKVVQDTTKAMKAHIKDLASKNQAFPIIKTDNIKFRQSPHFKPLMRINGSRNINTQGYVLSNGLIFAEQDNQRLQKADNRFYLQATTTKLSNGNFNTIWRVDNIYDFEPFSKGNKFTNLALNENMILKLPDGLSEYMDSGLSIAKPFDYHAEWTEVWK